MGGRRENQDNRKAGGRNPNSERKPAPSGKTGAKPPLKSKRS